jgi:enoyl-CoA hydratase
VEPGKLMEEALALAKKLLKQPRHALREIKKLMNLLLHHSAAQMLDTTLARQLAATLSNEHHEIASAFIAQQKREQG